MRDYIHNRDLIYGAPRTRTKSYFSTPTKVEPSEGVMSETMIKVLSGRRKPNQHMRRTKASMYVTKLFDKNKVKNVISEFPEPFPEKTTSGDFCLKQEGDTCHIYATLMLLWIARKIIAVYNTDTVQNKILQTYFPPFETQDDQDAVPTTAEPVTEPVAFDSPKAVTSKSTKNVAFDSPVTPQSPTSISPSKSLSRFFVFDTPKSTEHVLPVNPTSNTPKSTKHVLPVNPSPSKSLSRFFVFDTLKRRKQKTHNEARNFLLKLVYDMYHIDGVNPEEKENFNYGDIGITLEMFKGLNNIKIKENEDITTKKRLKCKQDTKLSTNIKNAFDWEQVFEYTKENVIGAIIGIRAGSVPEGLESTFSHFICVAVSNGVITNIYDTSAKQNTPTDADYYQMKRVGMFQKKYKDEEFGETTLNTYNGDGLPYIWTAMYIVGQ